MKAQNVKRNDIQREITDALVARLEQGGLPPWSCPWLKSGERKLPYNWQTDASYRGINILILWERALEMGFTRNAWLTFQQALSAGGCVRKGEKGVTCFFFKLHPCGNSQPESNDENTELPSRVRPLLKSFTLFNVEQCDGLELPTISAPPFDDEKGVVARVESMLAEYSGREKIDVRRGGDSAYYYPAFDRIVLPTTFTSAGGFAGTATHEMIHSTGHKKRLNRKGDYVTSFKDKDDAYAFEELVAEIGAHFMCAEIGVDGQHEQHASYIGNWLSELKNDKTFLFRAAAAASKAQEFIMDRDAIDCVNAA